VGPCGDRTSRASAWDLAKLKIPARHASRTAEKSSRKHGAKKPPAPYRVDIDHRIASGAAAAAAIGPVSTRRSGLLCLRYSANVGMIFAHRSVPIRQEGFSGDPPVARSFPVSDPSSFEVGLPGSLSRRDMLAGLDAWVGFASGLPWPRAWCRHQATHPGARSRDRRRSPRGTPAPTTRVRSGPWGASLYVR
jgi:hypothetical protein